jgi:hypothetical protein
MNKFSMPILIMLLTFIMGVDASTAQTNKLSKRRSNQLSEKALVQKSLAGFIYGIQHNMPGYALEYFMAEGFSVSADPKKGPNSDFYTAIRAMKGVGNKPILIMAKPRITIIENSAIVDCHLIWHFCNNRNETIRMKRKERFILVKEGGEYRITGAELTPLVIGNCNDGESLTKAIREMQTREGIGKQVNKP